MSRLKAMLNTTELPSCIIAIDFDGTCVKHRFPELGEDIGAVPVLKELVNAGHRLILWTMRPGDKLDAAVKWFADNDIPLWGVNENPEQKTWTTSPKAHANLYIDDCALGIPLLCAPQERPWVDWDGVKKLLFSRGYI